MRRGFTMIELVFVIVIIGILAAVALPRLTGIKDQAHAAKAGEFVAQLNSVVLPNMYSKAVIADKLTSTRAITNLNPALNLEDFIEIPKGFSPTTVTLDSSSKMATADSDGGSAQPLLSNTTNKIYIYCRDGNETEMPRCWYSSKSAADAGDFNVSKSSF